jgi:hypothetical protein
MRNQYGPADRYDIRRDALELAIAYAAVAATGFPPHEVTNVAEQFERWLLGVTLPGADPAEVTTKRPTDRAPAPVPCGAVSPHTGRLCILVTEVNGEQHTGVHCAKTGEQWDDNGSGVDPTPEPVRLAADEYEMALLDLDRARAHHPSSYDYSPAPLPSPPSCNWRHELNNVVARCVRPPGHPGLHLSEDGVRW